MGLIDRIHQGKGRTGLRPNDPCPCGSGKPVKVCCADLLRA